MADFRRVGLRWASRDQTKQDTPPPPKLTYEDITPASGWTQEPHFHHLLVDLPGFKKHDIKLQVDTSGSITISGERSVTANKRERFQKTITLPKDVDIGSIETKFEGEVLKVSIKRVVKEEPESKKEASKSESLEEKKEEEAESKKEASKNEFMEEKKEEPEIKKEASKNEFMEEKKEEAESKKEASKNEIMEEKKEKPESKMEASKNEFTEEKKEASGSEFVEEKKEEPESQKEENIQKTNGNEKEQKSCCSKEGNQREQNTSKKSVIVKIIDSRGIIIASIVSFTLGFLLSQRCHSPPSK